MYKIIIKNRANVSQKTKYYFTKYLAKKMAFSYYYKGYRIGVEEFMIFYNGIFFTWKDADNEDFWT